MLPTIFAGLKGSFNFEKSLIEHISCEDEVDREILRLLFETGSPGLLPKDLVVKLEKFKVTPPDQSPDLANEQTFRDGIREASC